ncbi:DUF6286 domain-containing protein [Actinotalea sp.]|uniref:DUF6286 domain-containing protein n=1 Tax=Actinotalea sp. TaxID=1872145 RepID=UPI003562C30D
MTDLRNEQARETGAMAPAGEPSRAGLVVVVAAVLALGLVALGVVLVREVLVMRVLDGSPWIPGLLSAVDGIEPSIGSSVVGGLAVALGLWLAVLALRPRVRRSLRVGSPTGVWIGRSDVAKLATRAALDVDGVMAARTRVSQRTVTVTIRTLGASEDIVAAVKASVEPLLLPVVGIGVRVVSRRA